MEKLPIVRASKERDAVLVLTNGQFFFGRGIGKKGTTQGELCFNTSLTGYQEIMTDPSYDSQIINFTMSHIGNVGANRYDAESAASFAAGLVIRDDITIASNFRSEQNFNDWLIDNNITGIAAIDTRHITSLIRDSGVLNALICHAELGEEIIVADLLEEVKRVNSFAGLELSTAVSTKEPYEWHKSSTQLGHIINDLQLGQQEHHIVVIDYGVKHNILNCLLSYGVKITVVNCKATLEEILALNPDGVFLSNGPGDPAANIIYAKGVIQALLERNIPLFGICMGHQLLSLASGLKTTKMHQGHRGVNHPVKNIATGRVEITSQNHGFCVENKNLPENVVVTHISLFDNSIEGIKLTDKPAFSVQYHPESSSGPHDGRYLFAEFIDLITKHKESLKYA